MNEILQKFATQHETYKSLDHIKMKNDRKIQELQEKRGKA